MEQLIVLKVGGSVLERIHPAFFAQCFDAWRAGTQVVIVHGGGPMISRLMEKQGKKPVFVEGRRVTDEETLSLVQMALSGHVNKQLVTQLINHQVAAIGISGVDLELLKAEPAAPELGYVGRVTDVNVEALDHVLKQGWMPVIASLGVDGEGQVYNINADEAAAAIAVAMCADQLILLSDVDGIQIGGQLLQEANPAAIEQGIADGAITGGMIPKARSALQSLAQGIPEVRIVNGAHANGFKQGAGTRIVNQEVIDHGIVSDVSPA
jgi:acetylglutamate kinase